MQKDIFDISETDKMDQMDFTGWTRERLGKLYDESSANFARRAIEHSWFWGKIFVAAKKNCLHGQWLDFLRDRDVSPRTASRLMKLYNGYAQIGQLGRFRSDDEALKALAPLKPVSNELAKAAAMPIVNPVQAKTENPVMVVDITTSEVVAANPTDRQPTTEEQIRAQDGAPAETQSLTARDLQKQPMEREPNRDGNINGRIDNGRLVATEDIYVADKLTFEVADWMVSGGVSVKRRKHGHMRVIRKGEVIR